MSTQYFIKIIPSKNFFFGKGEEERNVFGNNNSYLLESLQFPQQTAILGLLRHLLLIQNGLTTAGSRGIEASKKIQIDNLIGCQSFNGFSNQNFGAIETLSPVFISNNKNHHFFLRDKEWLITDGNILKAISKKIGKFTNTYLNTTATLPVTDLQNFNSKNSFSNLLVNENGQAYLREEGKNEQVDLAFVFSEAERVGIRQKRRREDSDEDAYFKQTFLRFEEDFCFGVYVTLSREILKDSSSEFIAFGKERSVFKVSVYKKSSPANKEIIWGYDAVSPKILLLSDASVSIKYLECIDMSLTETAAFRNLSTSTSQINYSSDKQLQHNNNQILLKKGSILYITDADKWRKVIANPPFETIGFNAFVPVLESNQIPITLKYKKM